MISLLSLLRLPTCRRNMLRRGFTRSCLHTTRIRSALLATTSIPAATLQRRSKQHYTSMASASAPSWRDWRLDPPTAIPRESTTLAHQADMPKLPVPELAQTERKLLASARALARTEAEWTEFKRKADDFFHASGSAEKLQQRLVKRAGQPDMPSWIAEWWDTQAYMSYRSPVPINVSYYYAFERLPQSASTSPKDPYEEQDNPAFVAASLVATVLDFRSLLLQGKIEPDQAGGQKLCMESYKWMFNACRIPAKPADYAIKLSEDDPAGSHFIVIRKNQYFKLPLLSSSGRPWSIESLERVLRSIYDDQSQGEPVGVLTAVDRDLWSNARKYMLEASEANVATLSAIESASFVLCLDPAKPASKISSDGTQGVEDVVTFSRELMHGNGQNRWWDKPLQWVVFDSGEAGFIGEHSCMDGTPTAKVNDYIGYRLSRRQFPTGGASGKIDASPLTFEIDDKLGAFISEAKSAHQQAVADEAMSYLHYPRYGKEGIKKQKCSPDGWVQMTMQLAYALTFPENPVTGTYEAAMTRKFALGRTETVRVCSEASKAFVLGMVDQQKGDKEKCQLFMDALAQHGRDMKEASAAQGVDRHLFGLKMINAEDSSITGGKGVDLFADPLFQRSGTWQLSTSLIYSKYFRGYGWGQVVPDGFGLPYSIHDNHIVWTVTSKASQKNAEYAGNLRRAADMLMDMSEHALGSPSSKL